MGHSDDHSSQIAVIGIAGRYPNSLSLQDWWEHLRRGDELVRHFREEELLAAGVGPDLLHNENYVRAKAILDDVESFDAAFFGFPPREAEVMDPQQRIFLECAVEALESAACSPEAFRGRIGVFAGESINTYLLSNLYTNPSAVEAVGTFQLMIGSDKDFLPTIVSYKLNLRGPSLNIQTACSTSLVAAHVACQSLLNGECDVALAGGVSVKVPQRAGYMYQEGNIFSPDGHCRPFDAKAQGTLDASGAGIVVLKRMSDAVADGDNILAVIRGSAINNDGCGKVGYTAPSIEGQAEVVAEAIAMAGVKAETITSVEAHGTGTALGDPIEVAALTQAFGPEAGRQYCALGSVKSNLGHLDAAAGVTGLIKAVLQLEHKELVPSLHYEQPNPKIDFASSPFYVNTKLQPWQPPQGVPRRAGVSSFGIGGTNAHVVLEEAPEREPSGVSRPWQVITVSAKTATALERACENLGSHVKAHAEQPLADVAYTQQVGRTAYKQRRAIVCRTQQEAAEALSGAGGRSYSGVVDGERGVAFLFPGQGAQYVGMGRELYETEEVFRRELDRCAESLLTPLQLDIRQLLYGSAGKESEAAEQLKQTRVTQPVLVALEWALAEQWKSWGVRPEVMAGHSIGEYTAAVMAGVMELEDALKLVAARGRLMQAARPGAMLSVPLSEAEAQQYLREGLWLSAVNAPQLVVIGGDEGHIAELERELKSKGVEGKRLQTSHAFHTGMMDEVLERFGEEVAKVRLRAPERRYVSNGSGKWVTAEEATSARYWVEHIRRTVRFAENVKSVLDDGERVLLEVGPGSVLSALVRQQDKKAVTVNSLAGPQEKVGAAESMARALARLWVSGAKPEWTSYWGKEKRHRLPLPTYPFERQRYWIEPGSAVNAARTMATRRRLPIEDWFHVPTWKRSPGPELRRKRQDSDKQSWLVFMDNGGVAAEVCKRLRTQGDEVFCVDAGAMFSRTDGRSFTVSAADARDYQRLFQELKRISGVPTKIVHFWSVTGKTTPDCDAVFASGFISLLYIAQALGEECASPEPRTIFAFSDRMHVVTGSEVVLPEKSTLLGPCRTIRLEYPHFACRSIDIEAAERGAPGTSVEHIVDELLSDVAEETVAYRGNRRWAQFLDPVPVAKASPGALPFRTGGVYLITGGFGGIGTTIAEYLAKNWRANLVLISRSPMPPREQWADWLHVHGEKDPTSRKISQIVAMEEHGGRVLACAADVCSEAEMSAAWSAAMTTFGRIDGVIHAAGVAGGGMMQIKTREMAEKVMAPKVRGTRVLAEVARNTPLDFAVLCSSITAVRSAFGQVDYCAANCYLDAVAQAGAIANCVSVNWDAWQEVGMAVNTEMPADLAAERKRELRDAIRPAEGIDCFERIMQTRLSQVLVSTMSMAQPVKMSSEPVTAEEATAKEVALHPRPELRSQYVGPRNETDATILSIWEKLLGVEQIGIHDNFFELGGHSLLATQVASRLRESLKIEVPLRMLFEAATVAELSDSITGSSAEQAADKDAAAILAEIEQLSDEEAERILAAEAQKSAKAATKQ